MKALPPKPLPMNPTYRSAYLSQLQASLQPQQPPPVSPRAGSGNGAGVSGSGGVGGSGCSELSTPRHHSQQTNTAVRESYSREFGEDERRTPERTQSGRRYGYPEQQQLPRETRARSVDASTRNVNGRQAHAKRGSVPQQKYDPGLEDDCAEYADRFLAGYEKSRLLGRGACAVVWLAAPAGQKGLVAIKQVIKGSTGKKRSDTEAARKEIMFGSYFFHTGGEPKLSTTRHPGIHHIAKLIDYVETKRDLWLVMEYGGTSLTKTAYEIKGEFLRGERMYRVVHLPVLQSMKRDLEIFKVMMRQLLSALSVLADHHIVHSDLKPDNILIEEDERHQLKVRLIDFGSAFTFDCPDKLALATPEYMPPEALETCSSRGSGYNMSLGSRGGGGAGPGRKAAADPVLRLHQHSQPWSFDMWSLGSITLELCLGTPLWLSYKCRVADDQRTHSAAPGLFAVQGRDPDKIMQKQLEALRQKGLHNIVRNPQGVPITGGGEGSGLELLDAMLAWDAIERISPWEALEHPWLQEGN